MTRSVSTVDEAMPPIISTAMRCITLDPVPDWQKFILGFAAS